MRPSTGASLLLLLVVPFASVEVLAAHWSTRVVSRAATQAGTANGKSTTTKVGVVDNVGTAYLPPAAEALTPDGRWILFQSQATDLVNGVTDTIGSLDVFLFDRDSGTTTLVSRASGPTLSTPNGSSQAIALSPDGRWVAYDSMASNIVGGGIDTNAKVDVFLFDRISQTTTLVSRAGPSRAIALSDDGQWVLYQRVDESAENNGVGDLVELYDRASGTVTLVSRSAASATIPALPAFGKALSADGRFALFSSSAMNVVSGASDGNGGSDAFLFDRTSGITTLISHSVASPTTAANGASTAVAMSPDGAWIVFTSFATDLAAASDSNGADDTYLFERATGTITLVSRGSGQVPVTANGNSVGSAVTPDGRWVLFESTAANIAGAPSNGGGLFLFDRTIGSSTLVAASLFQRSSLSANGQKVLFGSGQTFLFDRASGTTTLVSRSTTSASAPANAASLATEISADGSTILFESNATDLVSGLVDANGVTDVFISRQMFVVTPLAGANGGISPGSPVEVESGDDTVFTVMPSPGYAIASVSGCGGALVGQTYTTGPIIADCTVTASFVALSNEIFAHGFESP
jgi:Tol biopolymer transport system component